MNAPKTTKSKPSLRTQQIREARRALQLWETATDESRMRKALPLPKQIHQAGWDHLRLELAEMRGDRRDGWPAGNPKGRC